MAATPQTIELPVDRLLAEGSAIAGGVPEGLDALLLAELARKAGARSCTSPATGSASPRWKMRSTFSPRMSGASPSRPGTACLMTAWRRTPRSWRERMSTLAELAARRDGKDAAPLIVLTTINAVLQRVPPHDYFAGAAVRLAAGNALSMASLIERLEALGYGRASTVTDPGQYAVRGGILDLYPPGAEPVRLDFFGDTLESIRAFDPETQRTPGAARVRDAVADERGAARRGGAQALPHALCRAVRSGRPATIRSMSRSRPGASTRAWSTGCRCSMSGWRRCSIICRTRSSPSTRSTTTRAPSGSSRSRITTTHASRRSSARPSARRPIILCRRRACSSPRASGRTALAGGQKLCSIPSSIPTPRARRQSCRSAAGRAGTSRPSGRRKAPMSSMPPWRMPSGSEHRQARARRLLEQRRQGAARHAARRARHRRDAARR